MVVFRNKSAPNDRLAVKYPEDKDQMEVIDQNGNVVGIIEYRCRNNKTSHRCWMYVHYPGYIYPLDSDELESIARMMDYLIEYSAELR